jgi:hypothetical protein
MSIDRIKALPTSTKRLLATGLLIVVGALLGSQPWHHDDPFCAKNPYANVCPHHIDIPSDVPASR